MDGDQAQEASRTLQDEALDQTQADLTRAMTYATIRTSQRVGQYSEVFTDGRTKIVGDHGAADWRLAGTLGAWTAHGAWTDGTPSARDRQPYTTVLGLIQTMQKAGLVEHEKEGLAHRYRPLISQHEATGRLLFDFLTRFFHGSAEQLILGLVDAEHLAADDLRAIEARLAKASQAGGSEANSAEPHPADKPRRGRKPS
jgi:predicted transcriptional regulator